MKREFPNKVSNQELRKRGFKRTGIKGRPKKDDWYLGKLGEPILAKEDLNPESTLQDEFEILRRI